MSIGPTKTIPLLLLLMATARPALADAPEVLSQACYDGVTGQPTPEVCTVCSQAVDATDGAAQVVARANLARCHEALGRPKDALREYRVARDHATHVERHAALDEAVRRLEEQLAEHEIAPAPPTEPVEVTVTKPPDPAEPAEGESEPFFNGQRVAALSLAAVGAAGLVAFAVSGVAILDRQSTVDAECSQSGGELLCGNDGLHAAREGRMLNVINGVSFGIGVASIAAATALWITAPEAVPSIGVSPDGASATWRVSF